MITIYEPKGKAREYSPLALNVYQGCDHECKYCYVPLMMKTYNENYNHNEISLRINLIDELEKTCKKWKKEKQQVLLSFTTDPYQEFNNKHLITGRVLEILYKYKFPVAILTKGGDRCLVDAEIFKIFGENIKIGATLTYFDKDRSLRAEPRAALPENRISTLKKLSEMNINTWVSFEPVLDVEETYKLFEATKDFVNEYKIGKINYFERRINWNDFLITITKKMREAGKRFYIKNELAKYRGCFYLTPEEMNADKLSIIWQEPKTMT